MAGKRRLRGLWLLLGVFVMAAQAQMLPRPQISSAEGKPAPEFALRDQDGTSFHLSAARGERVLLLFYRGYW